MVIVLPISVRGQVASCAVRTLLSETAASGSLENGGGRQEDMPWCSLGCQQFMRWEMEELGSAFPGEKGSSLEACTGHGLLSRYE